MTARSDSRKKALLSAFLIATLGVACFRSDAEYASQSGSSTFAADPVELVESTVTSTDGWGFPSSRRFTFSVCLRDQAELQAVVDESFEISDGTRGQMAKTDSRGCLRWSEEHGFDYLAGETYFRAPRKLIARQQQVGSVDLPIAIDPWRSGPASTIDLRSSLPSAMVDSTGGAAFEARLVSASGADGARLEIGSVVFDFLGHAYDSYEVDEYLNLTIAHEYKVSFPVQISRRSLSDGWVIETPLRGKVGMKLALRFKGALSSEEDVAVSDATATLESPGKAVGTVVFQYAKVRDHLRRRVVQLEVSPLGLSGAGRRTLEGAFPIRLESGKVELTGIAPREFKPMVRKQQKFSEAKLVRAFEAKHGVKTLTNEQLDVASQGLEESHLLTFEDLHRIGSGADPGSASLKKLCRYVFPFRGEKVRSTIFTPKGTADPMRGDHESALSYCLRAPEGAFSVVTRELMSELLDRRPVKQGAGDAFSLALSTVMSKSTDQTSTSSTGHRTFEGYASEGRFGVGFNDLVSVGIGGAFFAGEEWFEGTSHSRSTSERYGQDVGMSRNFNVETMTFGIKAKVRPCAAIKPAYNGSFTPMLICSRKTISKTVSEKYYFMKQRWTDDASSNMDPNGKDDAPMNFVIRGEEMYDQFFKLTQSKTRMFVLERTNPVPDSAVGEGFEHSTLIQEFPATFVGPARGVKGLFR